MRARHRSRIPGVEISFGAIPAGAIVAATILVIGAGCGPVDHTAGEAAPADTLADLSPSERPAGSPRMEALFRSAAAGTFDEDPHRFECARCHTGESDPEDRTLWRFRCQTSDCHPRAWTETVYHRLAPSTFTVCVNCHVPHVWTANGEDCRSCHGDMNGPRGSVEQHVLATSKHFEHSLHWDVDCRRCHETKSHHASRGPASSATCMSCHHGTQMSADCSSCHDPGSIAPLVTTRVAFDIGGTEYDREVSFPHPIHVDLECSDCHTSRENVRDVEACVSCHDFHHDPGASCVSCHTPPPSDAHDVEVHEEACSSCHERTEFDAASLSREVCLVCHRAPPDHDLEDEEACTSCHDMPERSLD